MGVVLAFLFAWAGWRVFEYRWYAGIIPAHLGISHPIAIAGQSSIREGCGAAIFRMDEATATKIAEQGKHYLARSMVSRSHQDSYHTFFGWQETPVKTVGPPRAEGSSLSPGLYCASVDAELESTILRAVRVPGAYYTLGPEKFLLVDPTERLIVLSYDG